MAPMFERSPVEPLSVTVKILVLPLLTLNELPLPIVVVKSPVTVAPVAEYSPPESEPPESVAPLIVPNPEIVGEPDPVILPAAVKASIVEALRVLSQGFQWFPFSLMVKGVFGFLPPLER